MNFPSEHGWLHENTSPPDFELMAIGVIVLAGLIITLALLDRYRK